MCVISFDFNAHVCLQIRFSDLHDYVSWFGTADEYKKARRSLQPSLTVRRLLSLPCVQSPAGSMLMALVDDIGFIFKKTSISGSVFHVFGEGGISSHDEVVKAIDI